MKLNHWSWSAAMFAVVTLGCGCSASTPAPARAATTITSADTLASNAPKVGRAHYVVDDEVGSGKDEMTSAGEVSSANELGAPKEPRRSDAKRQGGSFGSRK